MNNKKMKNFRVVGYLYTVETFECGWCQYLTQTVKPAFQFIAIFNNPEDSNEVCFCYFLYLYMICT